MRRHKLRRGGHQPVAVGLCWRADQLGEQLHFGRGLTLNLGDDQLLNSAQLFSLVAPATLLGVQLARIQHVHEGIIDAADIGSHRFLHVGRGQQLV